PELCTEKRCSHACGVTSKDPLKEMCYCPKGMQLDPYNETNCIECNTWWFGDNCENRCTCDTERTVLCNKTNGHCECRQGWTSDNCDQDIDECLSLNMSCTPDTDHAQCTNALGSFNCGCLPGYEQVNETFCDDCGKVLRESSGILKSSSYAESLSPSQFSFCNWTIEAPVGSVVSFRFSLPPLYMTGTVEIYDGNTSDASKKIAVYDLYWLSYYSRWPLDWWYRDFTTRIVRTTQNIMFIVRQPAYYNGFYGVKSSGFNATYWTHECPKNMYGETCSIPCPCVDNNTVECDNISGSWCSCKPGWTGSYCSVDINECLFNPSICPSYSMCFNYPGSSECMCNQGLTLNSSNLCTYDVNTTSCTLKNCSHLCVSFTPENQSSAIELCYCPIGMELDGDQCVECRHGKFGLNCELISRCSTDHTESYDTVTDSFCGCYKNWTGQSCEYDFNECYSITCPMGQYCYNTYGGYECYCDRHQGYTEADANTCKHIDCNYVLTNETGVIKNYFYPEWYITNNANCSWLITVPSDFVISLRFSTFYLNCADQMIIFDGDSESKRLIGRYCFVASSVIRSSQNQMLIRLTSNGEYDYGAFYGTYTSHVCRSFTYGKESCDTNCRCVKENTQFCENVNGVCICKPGWSSEDCSTDVNECLGTNNKVCPPNSDCVNTKGSYRCECHLGFRLNSTGYCQEHSDCVYKSCSHSCYIVSPGVEQCLCPDGLILDEETQLKCTVPYYTYGKRAGDSVLSEKYTSYGTVFISETIRFSTGAPFGDQYQYSANILSKGVIGFGDSAFAVGGATDLNQVANLNILAPYMANINPNFGEVYYHLYEKHGGSSTKSPYAEAILARAQKDVIKYHQLSKFDVNRVLVTTFADVQPFSQTSQTEELNTFQAIYISGWDNTKRSSLMYQTAEGESAYVIFIYQYGKMKWNYVPGRAVSIGTTGKYFNRISNLDSSLVASLDKVPGNTGTNGVMSFLVGRVKGQEESCTRYVYNSFDLVTSLTFIHEVDDLYDCPCSLDRLGFQWEFVEYRYYGGIICYTIRRVAKRRFLNNNPRNKLCCYFWNKDIPKREATYISEPPYAGQILVGDPWDTSNYYVVENRYIHQQCCNSAVRDIYCQSFLTIYFVPECSPFVPFVPAIAVGDPHITTLDGLTYTMNGWGEYILLYIPQENCMIQGRTERAEGANGSLTNATVFSAFAAKESNYSSFQVELSRSKTSMVMLAGGIDITNDFYKGSPTGIIVSTDYLGVTREDNNNKTMVVVAFPSGVVIKVYVASKSLLIEFNVPKDLQNVTKGLLGNFNGNLSDEFILPDGTVLSANISEREIYHLYAKSWEVTPQTSVFTYMPGESTETYQHPEFEPFYRDEADPTAVAKAKALCGETNDACIFDYIVTEDQHFAMTTKDAKEEMEIIIISLDNTPPTIKVTNGSLDGNGFWFVQNGTLATLQVIVDDADGDTVSIDILVNATGLIVNKTGFISYLPNVKQPFSLRLRAVDSKGSYSPDLYIPLLVCPQCNSHGTCDTKTVREEYENGKFKVLSCSCHPAYTGKDCETEVDGCAIQPCFKGQTCTDLTAVEQGNSTIGYKCGPCPTGFQASMGTCIDVNECISNKTCDHWCLNTEGSYKCSCRVGYRLETTDFKTCRDINECEERSSNCQHKCTNTEGNYTCTCYTGYTLDPDGYSCNIDSSIKQSCYDCMQVCIPGENITCGCRLGFKLGPTSINDCIDIDECKYGNQPCSQQCNNLDGSYECSCYTGYKLGLDKVSCSACEAPYYGKDCASTCQCNGRGYCDPVRGCVCNNNWSGANCELDVDECLLPTTCNQGFLCFNSLGSYKCECPAGYNIDNMICKDVNECSDPTVNITCDLSLEVCRNNIGSYSCDCKQGYSRNQFQVCVDIDECSADIDKCEQVCENKAGSYNCLCSSGFVLSDDRRTCVLVKDACIALKLNCSYGCRLNSTGGQECFCPKGYQLTGQEKCEDINECVSNQSNLCSNKNGCINTNGSFLCTCEVGFKLDNDNRSCIACNSGTWGLQCANSCACGLGADHCDSRTGCVCKAGYTGSYCDQDLDECSNGALKCNITEKCINLPGTATCNCLDGFEIVNGSCKDVNECSSITTNNCSQRCENTEGGYRCMCYSGYTHDMKTNTCHDIDECQLQTSSCEQLCINTEGSYRCSCNSDLFLQADGLTCKAFTPCINTTDCSFDCANINGTETCLCPKGRRLANNSKTCEDIDLCASTVCRFGCLETKGNTSFECVCAPGQVLDNDGVTCNNCSADRWGVNCSMPCNCPANTTERCDNVLGTCYCKIGWAGSQCNQDVDECTRSPSPCPTLSKCTNTIGAFTCLCEDGYILNLNSSICE
ncbi:latent-transforming growth factor beta-binding protein 4, partial [Biomphalaria glabrata]